MSRLHEPFKLPKHPVLLHDINEMVIAIKLHHFSAQENLQDKIIEARERVKEPVWSDICELLKKCYTAINEQTEDPRKY